MAGFPIKTFGNDNPFESRWETGGFLGCAALSCPYMNDMVNFKKYGRSDKEVL